jgi:hypothetical protein
MIGRTNAGSGRLTAIIAVTCPEGSVCTVTNGYKTYKAKDTSGAALFSVAAGDWTVSCTDGEHTVSKGISVEVNSAVNVKLMYEFYIFKEGEGLQNDFTVAFGTPYYYPELTNDYVQWSGDNSAHNNTVVFKPQIDLSPYSSVNFELICTKRNASTNYITIGVGSDLPTNDSNPGTYVAYLGNLYTETRGVYSVDISEITDSLYIKMNGVQVNGRIYNCWLS